MSTLFCALPTTIPHNYLSWYECLDMIFNLQSQSDQLELQSYINACWNVGLNIVRKIPGISETGY